MEENEKVDFYEEREQLFIEYVKAMDKGEQDEFVIKLLHQKVLELQNAFNNLDFATSLLNNSIDVNDFLVNKEHPYPFELSLDEQTSEVDSWADAVLETIEANPLYKER